MEKNLYEINFWHIYEGEQEDILKNMVAKYNSTVGRERGVKVSLSYKPLEEIESILNDNINNSESIENYPELSFVSGEVACTAHMYDIIVPAENYLSQDELSQYFSGFISEGQLTGSGETYIFPISKSVETTIINGSIWNGFSATSGYSFSDWQTWNGIMEMGKKYYSYSEGKSLIAIENLSEFILTYSAQKRPPIIQSGNKEIKININKETMHEIWDIYFGGVVKGHIYQTDNVVDALETGKIVAYIGKPHERTFYADYYINESGVADYLSIMTNTYPFINDLRNIASQNGEGVCVFDYTDDINKESYYFLNWLCTNKEAINLSAAGNEIASCKKIYKTQYSDEFFDELKKEDYTKSNVLYDSIKQISSGSTYGATKFVGYNDFCEEIADSLKEYSRKGARKVQSLMLAGQPYSVAISVVDDSETFENWYKQVIEISEKY